MSIRTKVILSMAVIIGLFVGASVGVASLLNEFTPASQTVDGGQTSTEPEDVAFSDTTSFASRPFALDEGYTIDLVDGWDLVGHTPDRAVDRYRFERKADQGRSIFTISIYNAKQATDFKSLITARYGASLLREEANLNVNGMSAERVMADFMDSSRTDVLVQTPDNGFLSLYGIKEPTSDATMVVAKEINFMQKSLKAPAAASTN